MIGRYRAGRPGPTAPPGSWANAPTSYTYRWWRCDVNGNNCDELQIGNGPGERLASADVGTGSGSTVTAGTSSGRRAGAVRAVGLAPGGPAGAITLPDGGCRSRSSGRSCRRRARDLECPVRARAAALAAAAFVGRFRITDTRGESIRDALVYAIALPYGWIRPAPETVTGTDGWATIEFIPTAQMPVRRAAVVFFVRARKPGRQPAYRGRSPPACPGRDRLARALSFGPRGDSSVGRASASQRVLSGQTRIVQGQIWLGETRTAPRSDRP